MEELDRIQISIHDKCAGLPVLCDPRPEQLAPMMCADRLAQRQSGKRTMTMGSPIRRIKRIPGFSAPSRKRPAIPFIPPAAVSRMRGGFQSWSVETSGMYEEKQLHDIIEALKYKKDWGTIVRVKCILNCKEGAVLLDYVPGEGTLSPVPRAETGRIMIIGRNLNPEALEDLFCIRAGFTLNP